MTAGQAGSSAVGAGVAAAVNTLLSRALALTDDERSAIAEARRQVHEAFHEQALRAAAEALNARAEDYARARRILAGLHVPDRLSDDADDVDSGERAHWEDVARLVQLALDDALLAQLTGDIVHPKHVRELYRSVKATFDA